jgi:lysophospholipase L1-like esterase
MNSFTGSGNDDEEEAKRSPSDNSALGEDLPRRPMATFDIDQQLSEDDDDYEYEDRPLVLEGSIAEARSQKSIAVDRENRIVGVSLLIGTIVALIVLVVTADIILTSMMKEGPTITTAFETAKALPIVPYPSLDLLTCPLEDTYDTYWTNYVDTAAGKSDSDRCGALQPSQTCRCLNPVLPVPRLGHLRIPWLPILGRLRNRWFEAFQRNLKLIADTVSTAIPGAGNLDVVLLGDSITEHWLGTELGMKEQTWSEHFQVYQELFQSENNNDAVSGLALGIGGDNAPHLLYRMLNGEMAELNSTAASAALQPAVWWILIGTNECSALCEADQIVTGTVRIVQEILERRPSATVVVNSILPRGLNWVLGSDWYETLTAVNHQMECYAASQERVEFFNATHYFVEKGDNHSGRVNKTIMTDQVHPAASGYRIWGQGIVDRVKEIKEQQRNKN